MTAVLSVQGLKAYYMTRHFGVQREVRAVDGVDFEVKRNEIYGLAGESSSGKTTLIKTIAASGKPPLQIVAGTVRFAFAPDILRCSPDELARLRWKHLSIIVQGSMSVLNPVRRIRESFVDFAFRHLGLARAAFDQRVAAHLARVRLDPGIVNAYPHELSGGMRQRVTIALATICRPEFVIADEPTTALDVLVQKDVLDMMREVQREIGSSVLLVTHDLGVHAHAADRMGIMYAGRLVEEAPTAELFRAPRHPYTAHLIASLPRIGDRTARKPLEGAPPNLAAPPAGCRFHPRCPLAMDRCRTEAPTMQMITPQHRVACFAVHT
ncbi:MAG TPA: ABC transporter ATP-binding protein [Chloroflexota bacterium]|nr:ABC transporter ATP-binding protein [Chloroflexota bacterium]